MHTYPCDMIGAEGLMEEHEIVLIVILILCIKLHLGHVNRSRKNTVHHLTVARTYRITHTHTQIMLNEEETFLVGKYRLIVKQAQFINSISITVLASTIQQQEINRDKIIFHQL